MKKAILCLMAGVAWTAGVWGDESPAEFLTDPPTARLTALGGSYSAVADDAGSLGTNPALLGMEGRWSGVFSQQSLGSGASGMYAGGSWVAASRKFALGAGLRGVSDESFEVTNNAGETEAAISPRQQAGLLGGSFKWGEETFGVAVKNVQVKVVDSASTWALDGGYVSHGIGGGDLRLGVVVSNVGGKLKLNNGSESLPQTVRLGGSMGNWRGLMLAADVVFPSGDKERLEAGAEYGRWFSEELKGRAQAGWSTRHEPKEEAMASFSVGAGVQYKNLTVDYAAQPFKEIGMTQTITLRWTPRG